MPISDEEMSDVSPSVTRRQVLTGMVGVAGVVTVAACGRSDRPLSAARSTVDPSQRQRSFDEGWRFFRGDASGAAVPSFDDRAWRQLDLPHDWQIEDLPGSSDDGAATAHPAIHISRTEPDNAAAAPRRIGPFAPDESTGAGATAYTVGGVGWYRKTFRLPGISPDQRVELRFDAIFHRSDVWINGRHLGAHPYGYTGLGYDLTPYLRADGANFVAVRVDTNGKPSRWYHGSGIYRHTHLLVTGAVRIPYWGVAITTPVAAADRSQVRARVQVDNTSGEAAAVQVRQVLLDAQGKAVAASTSLLQSVRPAGTATFAVEHSVDAPTLWSIDTPYLYTAVTEIVRDGEVLDRVSDTFGIRSIVMNAQGFRLNGKAIEMRGVNIHHDHGPLGAVGLQASEDRRIRILREAGFNAYRSAHNPASPELLKACDRYGMLVYEEAFDTWNSAKAPDDYSRDFAEWWQRDVEAWVKNARNHPSVVVYSIGNEIGAAGAPVTLPGLSAVNAAQGQAIAEYVRSLDATRPICQGGAQGILVFDPLPVSTADPYTDVGDIHYGQTYGAKPAANPDKAWLQSESMIATIYEDWKLVTDNAFAIGDFIWTGWDYLGEAGIGAAVIVPASDPEPGYSPLDPARGVATQYITDNQPYPYFTAGCGEFDLIGQAKPQLRYRQVIWGDSPLELMVERPVGEGMKQKPSGWGWYDELESWTWSLPAGQVLRVRAYTTADSITLQLNGRTIQNNALTASNRRYTVFHVPYEPGALVAIAYRGAVEIGRKALITAGAPAALRLTADVSVLGVGRDELAHVLVEVVDAQRRRVPDAVAKVGFEVSGAGSLAAVASGNPHNVDSFRRARRHTWHGQALAILRPAQREGRLTLRATATGLTAATLSLPVVGRV